VKKRKLLERVSEYFGISFDYPGDFERYSLPITGSGLQLSLCAEAADERAHLQAFEQSMQALIDARASGDDFEAYLVIDVEALERKAVPSYRAALKKYSNAIVFEDLRIGVILVGAKKITKLLPGEVNGYLRALDKNIHRA
jgi:hypothetical protein